MIKKLLLFAADVMAFMIAGAALLAFAGMVCFGLWYLAVAFYDYVTSYEGRSLGWGIACAGAVAIAFGWLQRRYEGRPEHPCVVCGKPAVGMRTSDRALLCSYHTGQRP